MAINVKLKGSTVTVHPESFSVDFGNGQTLEWKPKDDSDPYDFDDPAITFDDANAPITVAPPEGADATGADNNSNTTGQNVAYSYHIHLKDSLGNHFTHPPKHNPVADSIPVIVNKPR